MTDVHAKIHLVKEEESKNLKYVGSDKANPFDPIKPVAEAITKDTWLLCFDEFQVIIHINSLLLCKSETVATTTTMTNMSCTY